MEHEIGHQIDQLLGPFTRARRFRFYDYYIIDRSYDTGIPVASRVALCPGREAP
jgi:hypothetical protein